MVEPDDGECIGGHGAGRPIELGPEGQVFQHAQARFDGVAVAAILQERGRIGPGAGKLERARQRLDNAGQCQQQGGLADPIGAAQQQAFAVSNRKLQSLAKRNAAPADGQRVRIKGQGAKDLPFCHDPFSY